VNPSTWGGSVTATGNGVGTLTITNFTVQANVTILSIPVSCTYKGTITASLTGGTNDPLLDPTEAEAALNPTTINKSAGSFLCPGSADILGGTYQLMGDKTTSDKVYDNTLTLKN
jgi:hypothetical protein